MQSSIGLLHKDIFLFFLGSAMAKVSQIIVIAGQDITRGARLSRAHRKYVILHSPVGWKERSREGMCMLWSVVSPNHS